MCIKLSIEHSTTCDSRTNLNHTFKTIIMHLILNYFFTILYFTLRGTSVIRLFSFQPVAPCLGSQKNYCAHVTHYSCIGSGWSVLHFWLEFLNQSRSVQYWYFFQALSSQFLKVFTVEAESRLPAANSKHSWCALWRTLLWMISALILKASCWALGLTCYNLVEWSLLILYRYYLCISNIQACLHALYGNTNSEESIQCLQSI